MQIEYLYLRKKIVHVGNEGCNRNRNRKAMVGSNKIKNTADYTHD